MLGSIDTTGKNIDEKVNDLVLLVRRGKSSHIIRDTAWKILKTVPEFNDTLEAQAIFEFVRDRVRYTRDPFGEDIFEHPEVTLRKGAGDCDSTTSLLGALLQSVGLPYKIKVVSKDGQDWSHVYGVVGIPKANPANWIAVDASAPRPFGWENPIFKYSKIYAVS